MLCAKFVFTVIVKEPNTYFTAVYKFFTTNRFGSACTISALGFVLSLLVLTMVNVLDCSVMTYETVNKTGIVIIFVLCTTVQYFFGVFFSDRKKG